VLARRGILRVLLAGSAAALAVTGLAGCRTSPTVAAYVEDTSISVARLNAAVAAREDADKAVAAYAEAHRTAFDRQVLTTLIDQRVYAEAARRYGVSVDEGDVTARYAELVAAEDTDQATVEQRAAQSGVTPGDVREQVRHLVVIERIAAATGQGAPLTEAALQQRYQQELASLTQKQVGFIQVADEPTAAAVLAQLTAAPASYPAVAAQYPGQSTLPALQAIDTSQLPSDVASGIASAAPGTGFSVPVQGSGVIVVFVGNAVTPTYQEQRPKLVAEAETSVDKAGANLVTKTRTGMHITVNPRYGVLTNGSLTEPTGGPVDILGSSTAAASPTTGSSGG
jgi:peptidyl-prolyl cis-trans isomerase SurA